jgi:hypothetical protein
MSAPIAGHLDRPDLSQEASQPPQKSRVGGLMAALEAMQRESSQKASPAAEKRGNQNTQVLNSPQAATAGVAGGANSPSAAPPARPSAPPALNLPSGYQSLERLSSELSQRDSRFSGDSANGRSAKALALAIGGTEVYGKGTKGKDFFTHLGGRDRDMLGFAQFERRYHLQSTNTPAKYTRYLGDILTGKTRMPNGRRGSNHAQALSQAVADGKIKSGKDLREFMKQRGFGGSNWQGIDDGWGRNPGLADALVRYLRSGS